MPWSLIDMTDDVEVKLDLFEQMYVSVLNEHTPIIVKRVKTFKQPPWFNVDLAKSIAARDRLFDCQNTQVALVHWQCIAKRDFYLNSLEQQSPNPHVICNHIKSSLAMSAVQPR